MVDTVTTNYGFTKPGVLDPAGANAWAPKLNTDFDLIDAAIWALDFKVSIVGDLNSVIPAGTQSVIISAMTASRTYTLPAANTVKNGREFIISDMNGVASSGNTVILAPAGADKINNAAANIVAINIPYAACRLRSNGSNGWTVLEAMSGIQNANYGALTVTSLTVNGPSALGATTISSNSATAFSVGPNGTLNPTFQINASAASAANGLRVQSNAAGSLAVLSVISSAVDDGMAIDAKGAGTIYLGANSTGPVVVGYNSNSVLINKAQFTAPGQCRLSVQDATHLVLKPLNGSMIRINGVTYQIPLAGVVLANGTFAGSTLYYIYAYWNGTAIALENSATGYGPDANGVMIKSGDATRTLVGMVLVNASSQFVDTDTQRWVLSWFNRQPKRLKNSFTATRAFSNNTMGEVNSEIRCQFICWADDNPEIGFTGAFYMSSGANGAVAGIGLDTFTTSATPTTAATSATAPAGGVSKAGVGSLAEGTLHTFSIVGIAGTSSAGSLQKGTSLAGEQFPTLVGSIIG